jgi:oligopeptide transport system substrate-binding protein
MRKVGAALSAVTLAAALGARGARGGDAGHTAPPAAAGTNVDRDAILSYKETEPSTALVSGNTTELGGIAVFGSLFRGLIDYDAKTGTPRRAVAESINTSDSTVWTIRFKLNWTFHDGSPVTAQSFVDAWNYTAYSPNRMSNASYLSPTQGFDQVTLRTGRQAVRRGDVRHPDVGAKRARRGQVRAVLGIRDAAGVRGVLPDAAGLVPDRAAFEALSIGNGPFRFDSCMPGRNVVVRRFDDYAGHRRPNVGGLEFRFYTNLKLDYSDLLANRLDYLSFKLGRSGGLQAGPARVPAGRLQVHGHQAIALPVLDQRDADPPLREAISMAIDRLALIRQLYQADPRRRPRPAQRAGPRGQPMRRGVHLPAAEGRGAVRRLRVRRPHRAELQRGHRRSGVDGDRLSVHPAHARRVCVFVPHGTIGEFRNDLNRQAVDALYRTAWVADYPSIENLLNPLFRTGAATNVGRYSNPAVDQLFQQADAASSRP